MSGPILILGAHGQLGRAFQDIMGAEAVALSRHQADLAKPETLPEILESHQPSALINAAAYTKVDKAEEEESYAFVINALAPGAVAQWCADNNVPLIHFSTDYVFDGSGTKPWKENDAPHPLNAYGRTKRAGEERVMEAGGRYLIFRISWVYDAYGINFFNTMLKLMKEREELRVVNDQHGAPGYAPHIARAAEEALKKALALPHFPSGIYHLPAQGETSWHGFATAIWEQAKAAGMEIKTGRVLGISSSEYPTPAKRPHNSRLDGALADSILGVRLPHWQEGLKDCMRVKHEITHHTA